MNSLEPIVYLKPLRTKLPEVFLYLTLVLFCAFHFFFGAGLLLIPSWRKTISGIMDFLMLLAVIPAGAWFGMTGLRLLSRSLNSIRRPVLLMRLDETGILIGNGDDEGNFKLFHWNEGPVASVKGDTVNPFLVVSVDGESGSYSAKVDCNDSPVHPKDLLAEIERFRSVYPKK